MINIERHTVTGEVNHAALMQQFKNRCEMRRLSRALEEHNKLLKDSGTRPAIKKSEKKTVFTIPLNNPKIKSDLLKCKKAGILSWDEKGKPDFISRVWLMALRDYWYYSNIGVSEVYNEKYKWDVLRNTFLVNGETPKIGTWFITNNTEYYNNIGSTKEQLLKILELSESEINILLTTNFPPT